MQQHLGGGSEQDGSRGALAAVPAQIAHDVAAAHRVRDERDSFRSSASIKAARSSANVSKS